MAEQRTFAGLACQSKGKGTRRKRFMTEMDAVIPWARPISLIEPRYAKKGKGRQPLGLEEMLQISLKNQARPGGASGEEVQHAALRDEGARMNGREGMVHDLTVTDAARADINQLPELVHGEESVLYGDRISRIGNAEGPEPDRLETASEPSRAQGQRSRAERGPEPQDKKPARPTQRTARKSFAFSRPEAAFPPSPNPPRYLKPSLPPHTR